MFSFVTWLANSCQLSATSLHPQRKPLHGSAETISNIVESQENAVEQVSLLFANTPELAVLREYVHLIMESNLCSTQRGCTTLKTTKTSHVISAILVITLCVRRKENGNDTDDFLQLWKVFSFLWPYAKWFDLLPWCSTRQLSGDWHYQVPNQNLIIDDQVSRSSTFIMSIAKAWENKLQKRCDASRAEETIGKHWKMRCQWWRY